VEWASCATFSQDDLRSETDALLGFVNFTWSPQELDCAQVEFDSIFTDDCFQNPVSNFHGIIGSSPSCAALEVGDQFSMNNTPFTFSPNPAGEYGLIASKYYSGEIFIRLYDNLGRLIHSTGGEVSPSQGLKFILSEISSGTYTLHIHSRIGESDLKIVVNK